MLCVDTTAYLLLQNLHDALPIFTLCETEFDYGSAGYSERQPSRFANWAVFRVKSGYLAKQDDALKSHPRRAAYH